MILLEKLCVMECQIRKNTSKLLSKRFRTFSLPVCLLVNLGPLFQPRGVVVCTLACRYQFTKIFSSDFPSLVTPFLGEGPRIRELNIVAECLVSGGQPGQQQQPVNLVGY